MHGLNYYLLTTYLESELVKEAGKTKPGRPGSDGNIRSFICTKAFGVGATRAPLT